MPNNKKGLSGTKTPDPATEIKQKPSIKFEERLLSKALKNDPTISRHNTLLNQPETISPQISTQKAAPDEDPKQPTQEFKNIFPPSPPGPVIKHDIFVDKVAGSSSWLSRQFDKGVSQRSTSYTWTW